MWSLELKIGRSGVSLPTTGRTARRRLAHYSLPCNEEPAAGKARGLRPPMAKFLCQPKKRSLFQDFLRKGLHLKANQSQSESTKQGPIPYTETFDLILLRCSHCWRSAATSLTLYEMSLKHIFFLLRQRQIH